MAASSKPVSQPPSIPAGSPGIEASTKSVVATVAERGISAATSTASAQPIVGAQPLTFDFSKKYHYAYEFYV